MSLIPCRECNERISSEAATCPKCGADLKLGKWKISDKTALAALCVSGVTIILGIAGAIVAYNQFKSSDDWKRHEFVAAQIKDFFADKSNMNVLHIIDYNPTKVNFEPDKKESKPEDIRPVYFKDFVYTINIPDERDLVDDKLFLRQQFEHFVSSLARFEYFVRYKSIRAEELCGVLRYPLSLLAGDPDVASIKLELTHGVIKIETLGQAIKDYTERWQEVDLYNFVTRMAGVCKFKVPYLQEIDVKKLKGKWAFKRPE